MLKAIINKIKISNPKIISINNIGTPPNYPSKNTLAIVDSGADTHLAKKATSTTASVIMSNDTTTRIPDDNTMESSRISRLQLPGLIKQARQIHIPPKTKTPPTNIIESIM